MVFATLVLLARDKAEGGRWLESRKKKKGGEGGKRQEERRKQPGLVVHGSKRTAMNLRLCDSVVECLFRKPKSLGSISAL